MRARPCRRYFNQAPASEFAFTAETPCMQNLNVRSSKLAAAPKCEAEADAMCVLVSAAGTPTKAPAGVFAFATEPPCTLDLTVRSSLRLLLGARRRRTQCACSSLPPALQPRHLQVCLPCDGAAMNTLHLVEQACGCFVVRGGGSSKA